VVVAGLAAATFLFLRPSQDRAVTRSGQSVTAVPSGSAPSTAPVVDPALTAFWQKNSAVLAAPARAATTSTTGVVRQEFARGVAYADAAGHVGYVTGGIRTAFDSAGADDLGVPLGLQSCAGRACSQAFTGGSILWSPDGGPQVVPATRTVRLQVAVNFRDVAGEGQGLELADGRRMKRGVVYRSDQLGGSGAVDLLALRTLGLSDIFDLRTPSAVRSTPDPVLKGVTNHLSNLFAVQSSPAGREVTAGQARRSMEAMNREFVTVAAQRAKLLGVLEGIANSKGPVLVHCAAGKDRTGWVSAMLEFIAGADETTVLAQYLESNEYRKAEITASVEKVRARRGQAAAEVSRAKAVVAKSYLEAGLAEAKSRYGSIERYLSVGVGLPDAVRARLVDKLVG
jgi:protein-tyrosine phosphatase